VLCSLLYIMWNVLCSLLYIMWNVLCSLLYIMWNVLCSLLYIMWNVLCSLLYIIKMLNATFCSTQNIGWDFSLAHYGGDKIPLNWYRLWNTSCLLRLLTPLPLNFKALFSSRNILRALNDSIVLLAGRCHVGHKNANRLHAPSWSLPRRTCLR